MYAYKPRLVKMERGGMSQIKKQQHLSVLQVYIIKKWKFVIYIRETRLDDF